MEMFNQQNSLGHPEFSNKPLASLSLQQPAHSAAQQEPQTVFSCLDCSMLMKFVNLG